MQLTHYIKEIKMSRQYKWNNKERTAFYVDLLEKFGLWKYWAIKSNPYSGRDDKNRHDLFNKYLEETYPNKKPLAQLGWLGNFSRIGLVPDPNSDLPTPLKELVTQKFNARNWWDNKITAYYANFVGDEVFPDTFVPYFPITKKEAWGQDKIQNSLLDLDAFKDIPPDEVEVVKVEVAIVEPCSPGRHSLYPDCNFCPNCGLKL
jgi:hypothetical protein